MSGSNRQMPLTAEGLVITTLNDETLVFDPRTNHAHNLDAIASRVFRHCDGKTPQETLAGQIGQQVLEEALDLLAQQRLIQFQPQGSSSIRSRRDFLKAAGVALPVIATLVAPVPAAAGSVCVNCGTTPFDCSGAGCTGINGGCARCETTSNPCPGADCICLSNKSLTGSNCATDSQPFLLRSCINLNGPLTTPRVQRNCAAARAATVSTPNANQDFSLCDGNASFLFANEYFCCENC